MYKLKLNPQTWPVAGSFNIAHGNVEEVHVLNVEIQAGEHIGYAECRPYARYGENTTSVCAQIEAIRTKIEAGVDSQSLQGLIKPGAARNALDCALWDLRAKQSDTPVWEILGLPKPQARTTAYTLSIDTPAKMARAAIAAQAYPILKLKIGDISGLDACLAVMHARPDAELIVDANEALSPAELSQFRTTLAPYPVLMIEQPIKAAQYSEIENKPNALPILCADESLHTRADLQNLWDAGYRAVNVKLDKCGGLSEAHALLSQAKSMGFVIMLGCMVGTSLAMAPMMMLESFGDVIDLDGPLLLERDTKNGLRYEKSTVYPPSRELWG